MYLNKQIIFYFLKLCFIAFVLGVLTSQLSDFWRTDPIKEQDISSERLCLSHFTAASNALRSKHDPFVSSAKIHQTHVDERERIYCTIEAVTVNVEDQSGRLTANPSTLFHFTLTKGYSIHSISELAANNAL
ncbi:hypothetical protein [Vibrio mediterranei]|uniref:hypothetical protein n=1 Tax=Vibrio mediterranei TaxID=689 RepID=UPI0040691C37